MNNYDRDTMTDSERQRSRLAQGKSRMQLDEITAEIITRKEQENES